MFRKVAFVVATTTALGAAALSPTSASAGGGPPPLHYVPSGGGHGHWGHHGHLGGIGFGIAAGLATSAMVADACLQREVFYTPSGRRMVRWVNVCY